LQFQLVLAEHLHKTVAEIRQIDTTEMLLWQAWFKMKGEGK